MHSMREDIEHMLGNGPGPDPEIADALEEVSDSVTRCSELFIRRLPVEVVSKFWFREE